MDRDKQDAVLADLRSSNLDCIVQVQMLGEGFDHPPLSVAAIFRPFASLSPYTATGRANRAASISACLSTTEPSARSSTGRFSTPKMIASSPVQQRRHGGPVVASGNGFVPLSDLPAAR
jgi:superfamily II DNA or RNA helicase